MTQSVLFYINGQHYLIQHEITLSEMIKYFDFNKTLLVLEYNSIICGTKDWTRIRIKNHDKIEIVTIVGGG